MEDAPTYSMDIAHFQQVHDELECLQSMFPSEQELQVDPYVKILFESVALNTTDESVDLPLVHLTLFFQTCPIDNCTPELKISFPKDYPDEQLDVELVCPTLPRSNRQMILDALQQVAAGCVGEVCVLQIYQEALNLLEEVQNLQTPEAESTPSLPISIVPSVVGRRAIYFHHIIAPGKRQVVKDWAKELQLGGFSKIGWPGVIIAEGIEAYVQEYVKRLQHLRWKQMVVRGEQTDTTRRLPSTFFELTDMSELAARCNEAGLSELFLTTMKIYRST
ncbi:hypothetical protein LEN26_000765 [Aphanomyces euteiches]|nr:hypothetical protein AeMF1_010382 [Aphanomyces euteiches]KAH9162863.1 hypothetical protein LEN26_000765 [Aphanomyces euteiches]KAH9185311.1 hypothetical protein AeNC1_012714 [Aphanomyces euteiches]